MKAIKVKHLFGENNYRQGRMANYVITVGGINYLPLDVVRKLGFIYETEDIEDIDYEKKTKQSIEAVSFENIFGENDYETRYDSLAIEKDGVRYLSMDNLKKITLVIMPRDIEEVELQ